MKILVVIAVLILLMLQFGLWFGQSGYFARERLTNELGKQQQRVSQLRSRNRILKAEVMTLKDDRSVLEARARHDLGMVKKGEVFYLIPDIGL